MVKSLATISREFEATAKDAPFFFKKPRRIVSLTTLGPLSIRYYATNAARELKSMLELTAPNVEEVESICSLPRPAPSAFPRLANSPASAAAVMAFARVSSTCLARRPLLCASIACALYARLLFRSLRMDRPARRRKASNSNWTLATCESRSTPAARLISFKARRWLRRAFIKKASRD